MKFLHPIQKPPRQSVIRSHCRNGATLSSFIVKGAVPQTSKRGCKTSTELWTGSQREICRYWLELSCSFGDFARTNIAPISKLKQTQKLSIPSGNALLVETLPESVQSVFWQRLRLLAFFQFVDRAA